MALLEPTNLLLLACALIYGAMGETANGLVLLVFVAGISLLDAVQQHRSQRALAELARLSAPQARLRRGEEELTVAAEDVQLGDLLRLEEGDRVAADAVLREGMGLQLNESLLTGESLPVARYPDDPILAGALVTSGWGWAEVVAVADMSALNQLGRSIASVQAPSTPLQRQTRQLTARLTVAALGLCTLLAVVQGGLSGDWPQALLAALALALAVLPNEIPVVLALFLALGALRLSRQGVLARWPAAVESLGSATVLAVDKTGTLTQNRMEVEVLQALADGHRWQRGAMLQEPVHGLLELAVLASREEPVDAMEQAIRRLALEHLVGSEHLHPDWPLERDYPLQPDLLVVSRLWRSDRGDPRLAAKGAPEAIADLCHLAADDRQRLLALADGLAQQGLRVLAVAQGLDGAPQHGMAQGTASQTPAALPHDYLFEPLGLIGLADPLRPDVPAAIAAAARAGVRVVMITGDGPITARAIANQAGLPPGDVLVGSDLDRLTPAALGAAVDQVSVFARVTPQQKLTLVRALQARGEVVAMTGDGVNDAPALKAADIGVAMGRRGTAVAREAADLVLLRDTFADLVAALALGRRVDANLHRALRYTLAVHLPLAGLSLVPLLLPGEPLLLLPVHIALLHLVIDPVCTLVFEAQPAKLGLMEQPPRSPQATLVNRDQWHQALQQGFPVMVAGVLLAFWPDTGVELRRSLVFSLLLLTGGGLVALNGDRRSPLTAAGVGLGIGLWLLLWACPPLQGLLQLAPFEGRALALLAVMTATSLGLAAAPRVLARHWPSGA